MSTFDEIINNNNTNNVMIIDDDDNDNDDDNARVDNSKIPIKHYDYYEFDYVFENDIILNLQQSQSIEDISFRLANDKDMWNIVDFIQSQKRKNELEKIHVGVDDWNEQGALWKNHVHRGTVAANNNRGELCGYASFSISNDPYDPSKNYRKKSQIVWIDMFTVLPEYRRRGLGSAMFNFVKTEVNQRKYGRKTSFRFSIPNIQDLNPYIYYMDYDDLKIRKQRNLIANMEILNFWKSLGFSIFKQRSEHLDLSFYVQLIL